MALLLSAGTSRAEEGAYSNLDRLGNALYNVYATNPSSGSYGLPQALPGSKMASAGADWATNPITQLRWMASYVAERYGGFCPAWGFWQKSHWY